MKTLVEIEDGQIQALDKIARREDRSREAIIRKAIDFYIERQIDGDVTAGFGLWGDREIDGLDYQARIRGDW
ncbi:MAG TPA: ribbon-helix-helix protein, CopG family [Lichenihabitans sp.]|jgi:predicted transcriptional regulator|nr:ribbon-helix-helix protein, CopG family [Lichenihabitans sp.]